MERNKHIKKSKHSVHNIKFWSVGSLLIITTLSVWLVSGLFAKYVITDTYADSASVAPAGSNIELWEHEANLENGIYVLNEGVTKNTNEYKKVLPGVDIAKDPFIRLNLNSDVTYELYIKVVESNPFPDTVTYTLTDDWELFDADNGIYKYKNVLNTQFNGTIKILKDDKLYVSEHYVGKDKDGNNQEFTLAFSAWLEQSGMN